MTSFERPVRMAWRTRRPSNDAPRFPTVIIVWTASTAAAPVRAMTGTIAPSPPDLYSGRRDVLYPSSWIAIGISHPHKPPSCFCEIAGRNETSRSFGPHNRFRYFARLM